jgi:ankyrin repeat protein
MFLYQLTYLLTPIWVALGAVPPAHNPLKCAALAAAAFYVLGSPVALYLGLSRQRPNLVWLGALPMVSLFGFALLTFAPLGKVFLGAVLLLVGLCVWITSAISLRSSYQEARKVERVVLGCGIEHEPEPATSRSSFIDKQIEKPSNKRYLWITVGVTTVLTAPLLIGIGAVTYKLAVYEFTTPPQVKLNNALLIALSTNDGSEARRLIARGADVNVSNGNGSALSQACMQGNLPFVKLLVEKGADIESASALPMTVAYGIRDHRSYVVADANRAEMVRYLLAHGAKPQWTSATGMMVLPIAIQNKYPIELLKRLVQAGAPVSGFSSTVSSTREHISPLIAAIRAHRQDVVTYLIEQGADVNEYDADTARFGALYQNTPLLEAVDIDNPDAARALIQAGAHIEYTNTDGRTPMVLAAMKRHSPCWKVLVEAGAKLDAVKDMAKIPAKREYLNKDMLKELKI